MKCYIPLFLASCIGSSDLNHNNTQNDLEYFCATDTTDPEIISATWPEVMSQNQYIHVKAKDNNSIESAIFSTEIIRRNPSMIVTQKVKAEKLADGFYQAYVFPMRPILKYEWTVTDCNGNKAKISKPGPDY
ncbi:MAG: hypothetical protein Q8R18_05870 [bacterium]|nr:hypothetical protein [bacterium]